MHYVSNYGSQMRSVCQSSSDWMLHLLAFILSYCTAYIYMLSFCQSTQDGLQFKNNGLWFERREKKEQEKKLHTFWSYTLRIFFWSLLKLCVSSTWIAVLISRMNGPVWSHMSSVFHTQHPTWKHFAGFPLFSDPGMVSVMVIWHVEINQVKCFREVKWWRKLHQFNVFMSGCF